MWPLTGHSVHWVQPHMSLRYFSRQLPLLMVQGAVRPATADGEGLIHGAVVVAAHRPDVASRAGADRVGEAMAAGLVDECDLFLHPILIGGGKRTLPDGVRARLQLLDEQRFRSGVVYLHYGVRSAAAN